ncbi:ABC transporter permease [Parabacteroides sp. FAFU027]|uniref:ABC transporter permease n=1 Tax=Parabacteroides sp. FAFU027 TaxID=2922715 RepID=UPI001FAEB583|nr:ABC transporter permease [Parabacteroides sp. FAFU027]
MTDLFKLAWRNLWRNKRRTLITTASVFFGVVFATFVSSMQEGSYAQYIQAIVSFYSGYIQVHQKGYWEDRTINNLLADSPQLDSAISRIPHVTVVSPRLENFALASSKDLTKGALVSGISPEKEDRISRLSRKIIQGKYLKNGESGVMIGSELARYLRLGVGDTLVLISQGYHGTSAAGKYPVRGIMHLASPELDRTLVYMDIRECQMLFSAEKRLTSLVIMVPDDSYVTDVQQEIKKRIGGSFEVMNWKEMNSLLLKQIESDRAGGWIEKGILYMIIGFGILGTIMMMMAERRKEFGVMMAVGTQKYRLALMVVMETVFIGLLGTVAGILGSLPAIAYFVDHPIPFTGQGGEMLKQMGFEPYMWFSIEPGLFFKQALIIFLFTLIIGLYPVYLISRLKIVKALKG